MSHTYSWDVYYGRPVTIDSVTLAYVPSGKMVEQNRSGTYTQIGYSPNGQKMQTMNGQASSMSIVALPGGGQAVFNATSLLYYDHPDHLGSTRFASTPSRTMYFDTAYAPFGEPYAQSGIADLSFTGQRQDTVSGLYDFPAREYSIQGRWPSPDPAGLAVVDPSNPQSWNRYAYVVNNPLALTDPLGLCGGQGDFPDLPCPSDNTVSVNGGNSPTYTTCDGIVVYPGCVPQTSQPWLNPPGTLDMGGGSSGNGKNSSTLKILFTTNPLPTAWKSLTSENGCGHKIWETFFSDLSPVPLDTTPGITDAIEPITKFTNVTSAALAIRYAAGQTNVLGGLGLIKPFASATFRGLWSISKFAEEAALPATVVLSGVDALATAGKAAYNGTCQ